MKPSTRSRSWRRAALALTLGTFLVVLGQCRSSGGAGGEDGAAASLEVLAAWDVVYDVLQHPRCANCHPAGDRPLVGDEQVPHPQNVQRGREGNGLYAMRCATCHQTENTMGPHMPPGAPHWKLPHPEMPLVFVGRTSAELCRQLRDPGKNGHRTPQELLKHVESDPLVLWGWSPGDGRAPIPIPHAQFVEAMRVWVDSGCGCPE